MKRRGPFLIVIALAFAIFVTWLGGYSGILVFTGDFTEAEITAYSPKGDPEGDWVMTYCFISENIGRVGRATFASKVRPSVDAKLVRVKYLSWAPSVSGVAGYISVTGVVAYLFASYTFWRGLDFYRRDRAPHKSA